jgi:RNA polymerase sigma-70 factor (ECF subfamily)
VQSSLLKLPYEFREAVVLCDVVGLTYDEIAEATDVPVGTVRSRIHRGRKQLRELLTWPV